MKVQREPHDYARVTPLLRPDAEFETSIVTSNGSLRVTRKR
jgi:hypothetical protein